MLWQIIHAQHRLLALSAFFSFIMSLVHCMVERIEHLYSHFEEEMERTGLCSYSKNIEKFFLYTIVTRC